MTWQKINLKRKKKSHFLAFVLSPLLKQPNAKNSKPYHKIEEQTTSNMQYENPRQESSKKKNPLLGREARSGNFFHRCSHKCPMFETSSQQIQRREYGMEDEQLHRTPSISNPSIQRPPPVSVRILWAHYRLLVFIRPTTNMKSTNHLILDILLCI